QDFNPTAPANAKWGTDRVTAKRVLEAAIHGETISVFDRDADNKPVLNRVASDAANEKANRVADEWRRWIWQDDARRGKLAVLYNDTFNTDRLREYDGAHLTLPGKVDDAVIELRPHQKNFIWRVLQSGAALADH